MGSRIIHDFQNFIFRSTVIDFAVGLILAAAFGKVNNSFVNDLIMPPMEILLQKFNFKNLFIALNGGTYPSLAAAQAAGAATMNIGNVISTIIEFLIVGASVFVLVRLVKTFHQTHTSPKTEELLEEIRDLLKERKEKL